MRTSRSADELHHKLDRSQKQIDELRMQLDEKSQLLSKKLDEQRNVTETKANEMTATSQCFLKLIDDQKLEIATLRDKLGRTLGIHLTFT